MNNPHLPGYLALEQLRGDADIVRHREGEKKMQETRPTIMTLDEVANFLRLHKSTVYRMAREGRLPGNKVAGQWRFKKERLVEWFEKQQELGEM